MHRTAAYQRTIGPITLAYHRHVQSGRINLDNNQLSLSATLDSLYTNLSSHDRFMIPDDRLDHVARYYAGGTSLFDNFADFAYAKAHSFVHTPHKGIYIHGSVGVGKSMLMDLFYQTCNKGFIADDIRGTSHTSIRYEPIKRKAMRCHFHEFMLDVHQRIHNHKLTHPKADPIPPVAASFARQARLLCFDEMQITDIADAMIMKRIMTLLMDLGVTIVTTSNRPPCGLYEGGINRSVFLPFLDTLRERMEVIEVGGMHDYRRDVLGVSSESLMEMSMYLYPCNDSTQKTLEQWFSTGGDEVTSETIPVAMGRSIHVIKANGSRGWFTFNELCARRLGAADYIGIAKRFDLVLSNMYHNSDRTTTTNQDGLSY